MIRPALLMLSLLIFSVPAFAEEAKVEDSVTINISSETWVTTQTARVVVAVEASVNSGTAGTARSEMAKAVENVAKADWRLISFNRGQDQTGMERWSARFEARLPESQLSGLGETAKKQSKSGMQLNVVAIDFSPTLAEIEDANTKLRTQLYKDAAEQLETLNKSIPDRNYRIATINFSENDMPKPMMAMAHSRMMKAGAMDAMEGGAANMAVPSMERSEKLTMNAQIVFAATPEKKTAGD